MKRCRVKQDCFCEHTLLYKQYYPKRKHIPKSLNKGDIVIKIQEWANDTGSFIRVIKDNIKYDINTKYLQRL